MEKRKRFLPCLLERLLDDEPKKQTEVWDKYHYDSRAMRALIQNSIAEILNTPNIEDTLQGKRHGYVAESVVNYGIAPLVGAYSTPHNWVTLEQRIREALIRFEPRLIADSIIVNPSKGRQRVTRNGLVQFEIRALIHWEPYPLDLCVSASYDTETSVAKLTSRN